MISPTEIRSEYTESGRVLLCKNSDVARKILIKLKRNRDYTDTLSFFFKTKSEYAISGDNRQKLTFSFQNNHFHPKISDENLANMQLGVIFKNDAFCRHNSYIEFGTNWNGTK